MSHDEQSTGGEPLGSWRLDQVTAASMLGWVEVLRDDNRIHVDPDAAMALGYGRRTVNPGPANLAYVLNMLLEACPGTYPATIEARFLGNVLSGDAIAVTGERLDGPRCHAVLRTNPDGSPALEVTAVMKPIAERP